MHLPIAGKVVTCSAKLALPSCRVLADGPDRHIRRAVPAQRTVHN